MGQPIQDEKVGTKSKNITNIRQKEIYKLAWKCKPSNVRFRCKKKVMSSPQMYHIAQDTYNPSSNYKNI